MAREAQLLAVSVTTSVNRISRARLVYRDGAAPTGEFPLSNAPTFVPGRELELLAGPSRAPVSIFKGIVTGQSLKVRDHTAPELIVECRHKASRLTVGRKNACYFDQSDADIIASLLNAAGISAEVEPTGVTHAQQVQYRCSDWDFLLARAEANGRLVFTSGDTVAVRTPDFTGPPTHALEFGATIIELDADMDSRLQFRAVTGVTWDPAQQSVVERDAADPGVQGPGNLTSDDLAAVAALDRYDLRHAAVAEEEAQAWADAQWLKSKMSKVSGRAKCEGIATIRAGDIVTIGGVGDRFTGDIFVTGVRHEFDLVQGWKTHIQFGSTHRWATAEHDVTAPIAGALLPGAAGLQIAVVTSNEDPAGEYRVRVRMPMVSAADAGVWARIASLDAGDDRGFFVLPEIGDEAIVGFLEGDPRQPVILGMLWSSARPAPLTGSDDNPEKVYQTRSKMKLYFNDQKKLVQLETPAGGRITLDDAGAKIHIEDQSGNGIEMTKAGIKIHSTKAIEITAGTELKLSSATTLTAKGGTELKLQGTSGAELSSTATTTIKGSLVRIN